MWIKPGDNVEEIALRMLKDKRLIPLLVTVNELHNVDPLAKLQAGMVLQMPSRSQILRYKIHVLQDIAPLMVYANTLGDKNQQASSDYIAYTCTQIGRYIEINC